MKTLGEVFQLSVDYLQKGGADRARRDAEDLLSSLLKLKRLDLYMQFDRPLEERELEAYRSSLKRRKNREPLPYILGEVNFFNETLLVSPDVLIPRQETELFLDRVCTILSSHPLEGLSAWDLCSGSGCLGIGLKKKFPGLRVTLSDLSSEALCVAKRNVERCSAQVEIVQGDLLDPFKGKKTDIIVCNPPYVSEEEYALLEREVKDFEPKLALVGGKSGLEYYQRLAEELPFFLHSGAKVFFEIGSTQGKGVLEIFSSKCWKLKRVEKDLAGHNRFFFLEFE